MIDWSEKGTFGKGALVGTLPQELSSLQLTGVPYNSQRLPEVFNIFADVLIVPW